MACSVDTLLVVLMFCVAVNMLFEAKRVFIALRLGGAKVRLLFCLWQKLFYFVFQTSRRILESVLGNSDWTIVAKRAACEACSTVGPLCCLCLCVCACVRACVCVRVCTHIGEI